MSHDARPSAHEAIRAERDAIEKARADRLRGAMAEYDRTAHYPALRALRERCAGLGHAPQDRWHDNGFGTFWRYCSCCGARLFSGQDGS